MWELWTDLAVKGLFFSQGAENGAFRPSVASKQKKTVLKLKISQKIAKNSFKIALNSSEAQPAWSLHATWVNNATEHKPALSVEQQLGPGAPIRAINVRYKTRNQMLRLRTPHPNDELGQLLWRVASRYLATDLHDVHRVDFTLPSMREGQMLRACGLPRRGDSKCRATERPPSTSHLLSSQADGCPGRGVRFHWESLLGLF